MVLVERGYKSKEFSTGLNNETHLHWKLYFGTETSGFNTEGGLNFEWSL